MQHNKKKGANTSAKVSKATTKRSSKKEESLIIPENERSWFYDKHGNVRTLKLYPTTLDGKVIKVYNDQKSNL